MCEAMLSEIYENDAIRDFGRAIRSAVRNEDDYSSLVELSYASSTRNFAEAIRKFLRRYETYEFEGRPLIKPKEVNLERLMSLVDEYGVKIVRSALVSHALTKKSGGE